MNASNIQLRLKDWGIKAISSNMCHVPIMFWRVCSCVIQFSANSIKPSESLDIFLLM